MEVIVLLLSWALDPLIFVPSLLIGALSGAYRVSVPLAAIVACGLVAVTTGDAHLVPLLLAVLFGCLHGALGLFIWRRVPERLKLRLISPQ